MDEFHYGPMSEALAAAGFHTLRFDFRGNGKSEGGFRFANYSEEVEDIEAAKSFLEARQCMQVIALVGHSKGGNDVVLYAGKHDGAIPLVVNICGRFYMDKGMEERMGRDYRERLTKGPIDMASRCSDGSIVRWQLTQQDVEARLALDMGAACARIARSRVLTVHGSGDTTIPLDPDGRDMARRIEGSQLEVIENADHNFRADPRYTQQLINVVVGCIAANASWALEAL